MKLLRTIPHRDDLTPTLLKTLLRVEKELELPIHSAYVTGSFASGTQIPTSDIDLYLVFEKDLSDSDFDLLEELLPEFEANSPELDITFKSLSQVLSRGEVEMKTSFLHIYGEPIHEQVSNPELDEYIYQRMHNAYLRMAFTRRESPYIWPMTYPNVEDLYKGYAWRKLRHQGKEILSIKEIVVLTGWMATGLTAWLGKTYVPSKDQVPKLFSKIVGGEIAQDFQDITDLCRERLHYLIPKDPTEHQALLDLLPKVLNFENFFIQHYHEFLLGHLHDPNPVKARTSSTRLADIEFHGPKPFRQK